MNNIEQLPIHGFFHTVHGAATNNLLSWDVFSSEWFFLAQSELKLIAIMDEQPEPPDHQSGDAEYGLILYLLLNDLPLLLRPLVPILRVLGMPASKITAGMYAYWITNLEDGCGIITSDGTLISRAPYAVLDPEWVLAFLYYLRSRYSRYLPVMPIELQPFPTTPFQMSFDDGAPLRITVFGDWGTGKWSDGNLALCPAQLVSGTVKDLSPEIVIHLSDPYYYGSSEQETKNLNGLWVTGTKASFTLNSNHEMYDSANGYFDIALRNAAFSMQQGTSYFAIFYGDWIVLGLDSAYFDQSTLYTKGTVAGPQLRFIAEITNSRRNKAKKIIVMTRQNAENFDAASLNIIIDQGSIVDDVYNALGGRLPDYLYYGHLHTWVVYNKTALTNLFPQRYGFLPNLRCLGHSGIPGGEPYGLKNSVVGDYFVQTKINSADPVELKRVLNGFAMIILEPNAIMQQLYEVSNDQLGSGIKYRVA